MRQAFRHPQRAECVLRTPPSLRRVCAPHPRSCCPSPLEADFVATCAGACRPTSIGGVGPCCALGSVPARMIEPLFRAVHVPERSPFTDNAVEGPTPVCSTLLGPFDPLRVREHIHVHLRS